MFIDKNGKELKIGDHIIPDEGLELLLTDERYVDDIGCDCLIGTQVTNPDFFSILTQENLSKQWKLVVDKSEDQTVGMRSITQPIISSGGVEAYDSAQNSEPQISEDEIKEERIRVHAE